MKAGLRLNASVTLVRPLGEGGMGEVWRARHHGLDVDVAVKLIRAARWRGDVVARRRFELEAQSAARIDSPHVVRVFDFGITSGGMPFIVMELLRGEAFDVFLHREGVLPLSTFADLFRQMARALHAAHEQGIVHRDVKPGNVFVTPVVDGRFVKVLDFGIAKEVAILARATYAGSLARQPTATPEPANLTGAGVLGTPLYMSPEQLANSTAVDARTDIWSLGVMAYQALTGRLPFDAVGFGLLLAALKETPRTPASTLVPTLPPSIDAWFDRILALDPNDRFQHVMDAANALDAIVETRTPEPIPQTLPRGPATAHVPIAPPQPHSSPWATSSVPWIIALVTVVIVATAITTWSLTRTQTPTNTVEDERRATPPKQRKGEGEGDPAPVQELDMSSAIGRAAPLLTNLRDAAGVGAGRTLKVLVNPAVAELHFVQANQEHVFQRRFDKTKKRALGDVDADRPTFDLRPVTFDFVGRIVADAEKVVGGKATLLHLGVCNNIMCKKHVRAGDPIWCVHGGDDSVHVCFDTSGRKLYRYSPR